MSDIVDRLRNPKRALWYCREFSRGDDESLDIQEAADEIERLRGLLQRHHELRGKPAREEWVDGGPTYRLAMQLWRDTAAALAGAAVQPNVAHYPIEFGPSDARRLECACGNADPAHAAPTPAPQPKAARFYGFRSEKLAEERAFHADMVFTEREQAEKVNTAPTTEVQK